MAQQPRCRQSRASRRRAVCRKSWPARRPSCMPAGRAGRCLCSPQMPERVSPGACRLHMLLDSLRAKPAIWRVSQSAEQALSSAMRA